LLLISQADLGLDVSITNNIITSITYNGLSGNVSDGNSWNLFKGTNMSDWVKIQNLNSNLANNQWLGASFGTVNARRPYIPTVAEQNTAGIGNHNKITFVAYPNPVKDVLTIKTEGTIKNSEVINISGQKLKSFTDAFTLNLSDLTSGIYFVKVYSETGVAIQKIIKE